MKPSDEHRNFATKNDVVLDKIVSIEVVDYKHKKVYDLTVPSTLNFGLANGLHVVDTASTGYMQRKLIKLMEDLKVNYAGIVEGSNNSIVAFDYGGDNYDGSKIIYKGGQPNFIDVESLCDKLNTDYEWEQYTKNLKTNIEIIVEDDIKDARKVLKGHMCTTYNREYITNLLVNIFKVPIPPETIPDNILKNNKKIWKQINEFTINEIKNEIFKNSYVNKIYSIEQINTFDDNELQRIYYWGNQQKNQMCDYLKDFLDKEGLLIPDPKCGTSQKQDEEVEKKKEKKEKKEKKKKE